MNRTPLIEIHDHVVYGVDDGARDMDASIQMLKSAVEQGIEALIATPHFECGNSQLDLAAYRSRVAELSDYLRAQDMPLTLYTGA